MRRGIIVHYPLAIAFRYGERYEHGSWVSLTRPEMTTREIEVSRIAESMRKIGIKAITEDKRLIGG